MAEPLPTEAELTALEQALIGALDDPGWIAGVDGVAVQRLLGLAVMLYAAKVQAGGQLPPFDAAEPRALPAATEVCLAASEMLNAVSVEIFELALWKSWAERAASD